MEETIGHKNYEKFGALEVLLPYKAVILKMSLKVGKRRLYISSIKIHKIFEVKINGNLFIKLSLLFPWYTRYNQHLLSSQYELAIVLDVLHVILFLFTEFLQGGHYNFTDKAQRG